MIGIENLVVGTLCDIYFNICVYFYDTHQDKI